VVAVTVAVAVEEDVKHMVEGVVIDVVHQNRVVEAVVVAVDAVTVTAMEPQEGGVLDALALRWMVCVCVAVVVGGGGPRPRPWDCGCKEPLPLPLLRQSVLCELKMQ
jgi:hypothetical protein